MEDSTPYRMPKNFNPFTSADAARGLADATHHFLLQGPGTQRVIPFGDKAGLDALAELLQAEVHALHDYLHEITNRTSLNLPMSDAEFDALDIQHRQDDGVKEVRARYG